MLARARGDFDGDGSADVAKLVDLTTVGKGCRPRDLASSPPRLYINVTFAAGGRAETRLTHCEYGPCSVVQPEFFTATDLDGDGRSELALEEGPGAVIQTVGFFRVTRRGIHPLRIAPEKTKQAGLKPGPAILGGNFDATFQEPVACKLRNDGTRVLVQTQMEMAGGTLEGPWRITRADLVLRENTLHVVRVSATRTRHSSHGPGKRFQVVCP